jgi:hypothetical protein
MVSSEYYKWIRNELFSPVNGFIITFNIIFFLGILLLFFWYILSSQFETIILDKVEILTLLSKNDPTIKKNIEEYLSTIDINKLAIIAKNEKETRNIQNNDLFVKKLLGWFIVLGTITMICFILLCLHATKNSISKGDLLLVFLLLFSFVTEIIFYFAVIDSWKFIGDYEIVKTYLTS